MIVPARRASFSLFAATCSLLLASVLIAQTPAHTPEPSGAAISPDGATVAWTLGRGEGSTLHLTEVADPSKSKLISIKDTANCASASPVWSPDGQTLAFLSTCVATAAHPEQQQVFLWSKSTGKSKQLTHLTGEIQQPAFSPSGKALAFLFVENATRSAGALDAMKPWSGVIGEDGVEVQRLYSISTATGEGGFVTPDGLYVYEFNWSPTAPEFTYIAANSPGANNWWIAKLYLQHQNTTPRVVFDPKTTTSALHGLQIAVPRFSPDGKQIAFIGGLMSDQGSTGGDVWVVDSTGGQPTDITPQIDGTPSWLTWISDHSVGFVEDRSGHTLLSSTNVDSHSAEGTIDLGEVSVGGGPIKDAIAVSDRIPGSKDRVIALVKSSFNAPPEIWAGPETNLAQLTHINADVTPASKTISVEWDNEGYHVQGWLTFPANYDASKRYPLIVQVHGGPSASVDSRWGGGGTWAEQGYFEFQPNPRGSFGQGEKFAQANRKDFGYGDLRDILKGMDMLEATYPIDKNREGLTGWSYGGFMTMFAVTQTHRFRAAVAGAGLSDWLSYYGENSIDQWMIPFFGASVYDDPAVYAKSSAINFIKNVTTPTLVIVGDRDGECPAPQSFEFWHALRDLGVTTQLVVYPDEGHGFRNPEHIRDRAEREAKWFARYMPETSK